MYVLMTDFLPTIQAHADLRGKGGGVGLFWTTPPPWKIQAFKIHMIVNYQQKNDPRSDPLQTNKAFLQYPNGKLFFFRSAHDIYFWYVRCNRSLFDSAPLLFEWFDDYLSIETARCLHSPGTP